MIEDFTIIIPCKYYLKKYLEMNCGSPADLSYIPALQDAFRERLDQMSSHWKQQIKLYLQETVEIMVSEDDCFRYGFAMTNRARNEFIRLAEKHLKDKMREYVTQRLEHGSTVAEAIRNYQKDTGMEESIFPYETIKKDLDRHGVKRTSYRKNIQHCSLVES